MPTAPCAYWICARPGVHVDPRPSPIPAFFRLCDAHYAEACQTPTAPRA